MRLVNQGRNDPNSSELFGRVVSILDQARSKVVTTINNQMVLAYWGIGRELVNHIQGGEERAEYGEQVIQTLSQQLTQKYGKGFSVTNLRYFRLFYLTYSDRKPEIHHTVCDEFDAAHDSCSESEVYNDNYADLDSVLNKGGIVRGFSSRLSWSHYRTLTKVENLAERLFYEIVEAAMTKIQAIQETIEALSYPLSLGYCSLEALPPDNLDSRLTVSESGIS